MLNLRTTIEVVVKNLNLSKRTDQTFEFGGHEWATPLVKKLMGTFGPNDSLVVSIGERESHPVMNFQWANGSAFVYCMASAKKLRREYDKAEKEKWK